MLIGKLREEYENMEDYEKVTFWECATAFMVGALSGIGCYIMGYYHGTCVSLGAIKLAKQ